MSSANPFLFRPEALRRLAERQLTATLPNCRWAFPSSLKKLEVPVVLQMSEVECGAACLSMVLGYFGRSTPLAESRERCGHGRDGVSARALLTAARDFGMRATAYTLETDAIEKLALPAILHWNFNHFVVLEKWSARGATILDPGCGRKQVSSQEFNECFTGVAISCQPGANFHARREKYGSHAFDYVKAILSVPGIPSLIVCALAASLLLQMFGLVLPVLTKMVVNRVPSVQGAGLLSSLCLGAGALVCGQVAASLIRSKLLIVLSSRLDGHIMLNFFEHLISLPFRFFQQRSSGDLLMRLGSNVTLRETLTCRSLSAVLDGVTVLTYLAILLHISPIFGIAVLGIGCMQVALLAISGRRLRHLSQTDVLAQSDCQSHSIQVLGGIETIKAAGAEDQVFGHWSDLFCKQMNASLRRTRFAETMDCIMGGLRTAAPIFLLCFGAFQVTRHHLDLGSMLALNALAATFLMPLSSLVSTAQQFQSAKVHLERIADVMSAEPEPRQVPAEQLSLTGAIELRNVSFRYDRDAGLALHNVSLKIQAGQKIALVGRTGSGKSTLAKLLVGLYQATEGEILFDGKPGRSLDCRALRSQWGVVIQDSFAFSGSIRENIALCDPALPAAQITEAAQAAALHDEIMRMPMGYETRLDEKGSCLSGGQRQRLVIARALVRRPSMMLLDEATSHLDAATEHVVSSNLDRLGCTRIVIAHRLSTVRNADLIVVMNEGSVLEQGTHTDLLATCGAYAELVERSQSQPACD